jgi:hypothetical protein
MIELTALVFAATGRERAFVLGLMASQRNMGLMLAATGGALPDFTWLYFALAQFPVYPVAAPLHAAGAAAEGRRRKSGSKLISAQP